MLPGHCGKRRAVHREHGRPVDGGGLADLRGGRVRRHCRAWLASITQLPEPAVWVTVLPLAPDTARTPAPDEESTENTIGFADPPSVAVKVADPPTVPAADADN